MVRKAATTRRCPAPGIAAPRSAPQRPSPRRALVFDATSGEDTTRMRSDVAKGSPIDRGDIETRVTEVLTWLEQRGTKQNRDGLARYGIQATAPFGVQMATIQS